MIIKEQQPPPSNPSEGREIFGETKLDTTIVFGEGPVKPVLLKSEATPAEQAIWEEFIKDPKHTVEPDFYIMRSHIVEGVEQNVFLRELESLRETDDVVRVRQQWQHTGRFALKRMGRQNSLAAGVALLSGATETVILSGGHTMTGEKRAELAAQFRSAFPQKAELPKEQFEKELDHYIKYFVRWPSEAELMADVIQTRFGKAYEEKYGRSIDSVMRLESDATNTLENIALTINKNPDVLSPGKKIGLLTANHHLRRAMLIAHRFALHEDPNGRLSAQMILAERALSLQHPRYREEYRKLAQFMMDEENNADLKRLLKGERRWTRGLEDPEYLSYWFGYAFEIEDPKSLLRVLSQLEKPEIEDELRSLFAKAGLSYDDFAVSHLEELAETDPQAFKALREKGLAIVNMREFPPEVQ